MPFILDNETANEFGRNAVMLKKTKKINGIAFFTYIIAGVIMICYGFVSLVGISWDWLSVCLGLDTMANVAYVVLVDALVVCPLSIYLTYRASLLHHDLSGLIVLCLQAANMVLILILNARHMYDRVHIAFYISMLYSVVCLATGGANFWAILKYRWLEKQRGFPQFSVRLEEYEENKFQRSIMDPYKLRMQQFQNASTGEMNDLGQTQQQLEKYVHEKKPDSMDEI